MGQLGQLLGRHAFRKAYDAVIARMDFHNRAGTFADGPAVVRQMGLIGRPDFPYRAAAGFDDVGNAEQAADFHKFSPGNYDFLPLRRRRQGQQYGGGVVIDDEDVFRSGQLFEQRLQVGIAGTAAPFVQVVFQVRV